MSGEPQFDTSIQAGLRLAAEATDDRNTATPGARRTPGRHARWSPPPAAHKRAQDWIDPYYINDLCEVTAEEYEAARKRARAELLRGKKPVPPGETPHLLITIGAPGAGKSTVASAVAERSGKDYVMIDLDVAVKYHPRYAGMWNAPSAVTGKPSGAGLTTGYFTCNSTLEGILIQLYEDIIFTEKEKRYNVILQSHSQVNLIEAKLAGYRTTLLFVGVPLQIAIQRSRARAVETGKFLAPTLTVQDEIVYSMWAMYRSTAAWYGLWADEFLVADNRKPGRDSAPSRVSKRVKEIPLHDKSGQSWEDRLAVAQKAIDAACED